MQFKQNMRGPEGHTYKTLFLFKLLKVGTIKKDITVSSVLYSHCRCDCISYQHIDGAVCDKSLLKFVKVLIAVIAC